MSQSLARVYLHIVFSTKCRQPLLHNLAGREEMHRYLGGICNRLDCPSIRVGGVEDHVHILCSLGRCESIADLVRELKRDSTKWYKSKFSFMDWQNGYGAFSVSPSHVDHLRSYIDNQVEHHKTESFQDEFRRILTKYGLEWDERYVWD